MSFKKAFLRKLSLFSIGLLSIAIVIAACSSPSGSDSGEAQDDENTKEQALFAGGSGTPDDPYQIETLEHLQTLSEYGDYETHGFSEDTMQHFLSAHYKQTADIDAEPAAGEEDSDEVGTGFQPIGTSESETYFTGSYNGNGYTISNLTMTREEQSGIGLFGFVADTVQGSDTIFKNITLENVSIVGRHSVGGVLGGYIGHQADGDQGNVVIRNSSVTGTVKGEDDVGGLAGSAIKIEDSSADCSITGTRVVGGLVGSASARINRDDLTVITEARIVNSHATGKVKAVVREDALGNKVISEDIGGLVGSFDTGLIKNSYSTGNIDSPTSTSNGDDSYNIDDRSNSIGGLVGDFTSGRLRASYATGQVTGETKVGGFVGSAGNNTVEIANSYATGNVTGYGYVGGFAGSARGAGEIIDSEAKGSVKVNDAGSITGFDGGIAGGFIGSVGKGGLTVTNSYAEGDLEGTGSSIGGFVGSNSGTLKKSYATGDISGQSEIGGFVGETKGDIIKSFAMGDVDGEGSAGGFAGTIKGKVTNSYALGSVSGERRVGGFSGSISDGVNTKASVRKVYFSGKVTISNPDNNVGGFCGVVFDEPKVEQGFWDTDMSGQSNGIGQGSISGNVIGLATAEMTGSSAEDNMTGFDFSQIWETTDSYPALQWQEN